MNTKIDITYTGLPQLLPSEANKLREHIRQFGPHLSIGTKAITEIAEHSGQSITIVNTITGSSKNYTVLQKSSDSWLLIDPDDKSIAAKLLFFLRLRNDNPITNSQSSSLLEESPINQAVQNGSTINFATFPADTKTRIETLLSNSLCELSSGISSSEYKVTNCIKLNLDEIEVELPVNLNDSTSTPRQPETTKNIIQLLQSEINSKINIKLPRKLQLCMTDSEFTKKIITLANTKQKLKSALDTTNPNFEASLDLQVKIDSIDKKLALFQQNVQVSFSISDKLSFNESSTIFLLEFTSKPEKSDSYEGNGFLFYLKVCPQKVKLHSLVTECHDFQKTLKQGANVNAHRGHVSILSHAVSKSQLYLVKRLLNLGAKTNLESMQHATTPLHLAAERLNIQKPETFFIFSLLLKQGANLITQDKEGKTPLELIPSELREDCKKWFPEIKDNIPCIAETNTATESTPLLRQPVGQAATQPVSIPKRGFSKSYVHQASKKNNESPVYSTSIV